ncbi:MAG: hypothetical protein KAW39_05750 [Thermoplasmata archaeon]|nr:hypothetical protein [Thermoplasmata archaeon]
MRSEIDRFLGSAARELRPLGPIERRRALAQIRQDIAELAVDGKVGPPDGEDLKRALGAMPEPGRLARDYLRTSRPPARLVRLASALCALLGLPAAGITALILSTPFLWVHPMFLAGLLLILFCALMVITVYSLAALAPARANRLRFVILLPATVCILIDTLVATAVMTYATQLALPGLIPVFLMLFGGAYCISYVHGQLPRLARDVRPIARRDYFLALGGMLSDLDLVRRREILEELERHVESSNLARDEYASIVRVLGPPEEVAESYLRDAPSELPKRERSILALVLVPAILGSWLGAIILVWGLFSEASPIDSREYLTPLGLVGSIGLLVLSLAVIGYAMRMHRAPPKTADHLIPATVLGLVAALIVSATLAGIAYGGVVGPHDHHTYDVTGSHVEEDGGLNVLWIESSCRYLGPSSDCYPVGDHTLRVTRLDADRRILSTERVPWGPVRGNLLDFERQGGTWVALFSDRLWTWGAENIGISFGISSTWYSCGGRIDGTTASMAWESRSANGENVTIMFRQLDWLSGEETEWMKDFHLTDPDDRISGVLMTPESVLVLRLTHESGDNYSRSALLGHLFDSSGISIADITLHEVNATAPTPDGETQSTLRISPLAEGEDAFWIPILAYATSGGVRTTTSHLVRVDPRTGNTTSWELHGEEIPDSADPHSDGDLLLITTQSLALTEERAVVGSMWRLNVWREPGHWEFDPSLGGLYVTSVSADGMVEYNTRVADVQADVGLGPLLSVWRDSVSVLVPKFFGSHMPERTSMTAYHLQGSAPAVDVTEVELDLEAGWLLSWQSMLGGYGLGVASGVSEFAGTSVTEDKGFLGLRDHLPAFSPPQWESHVHLPLIVRVDVNKAEVVTVPLTSPRYAPHTAAGLLIAGVSAGAAVAVLHFGHRSMRLRGIRRGRHGPRRPSPTEQTGPGS